MNSAGATTTGVPAVHVVLPGDVDDPSVPSGGNTYDRLVCDGLTAAGWSVRESAVRGGWPNPGPAEQAELAGVLAGIPDGAVVLLDGLVACAAPDVVVPQAGRLRQVVLVHLPLADETGLSPDEAAQRSEREGQTLRAATAVVATSGWAARRLIDEHGLPTARVHVAAPGVAAAPLAPGTDDGGSLLCVAAVTPRKGQDLLIEALATLPELPWTCVCVGSLSRAVEYVDRLGALIRRHGLGDRVRLVGPQTGAELAASYAGADLMVLASHAETYGMVVTEALARGIPVLATEVGGVPEALGVAPDGSRPGLLVPPGDPIALAGALRRWLGEPELRQRLRRSASDRRDALPGWAATTRSLAELMDWLLRVPGHAG